MRKFNVLDLPDRIAARFAAYSVAGLANAVVGVSAILIAGALGTGALLANVIGYGLGLVVSFTLNSRITFRGRAVDQVTVARFVAAFALAFAVNLGVVFFAERVPYLPGWIASLAGTPVYVVLFFLLCERWVFRFAPSRRGSRTDIVSGAPR